MLHESCLSSLGAYYVDRIKFSSDAGIIGKLLDQTEEFRLLLIEESQFPVHDYFDLTPELLRLKLEGTYIEKEDLFDLKSSLKTIVSSIVFIKKLDLLRFKNLHQLISEVIVNPGILERVNSILNEKGEIKDSASEELKEIRVSIRRKESSINKKIGQTLAKAKKSGWVADDVEATIRNGRLVIPISASNKRMISGFIHDESSTGQTVFLEPSEIFETNNEIRELENAERREITKILKVFSQFLRPNIPELIQAYRYLGLIDFIRAKAKLALKINAICPVLVNEQKIAFVNAVHPLLFLSHQKQNKEIVPLTIELYDEQRILVISGPNAGGKSVCLKTIGLLQYMLQCGLLIPVMEGSVAGIFNNLFIDIGDEQSLENDLSTYSSHLLNMKHFVLNADEKTIFLIDEFGTGTEPQLGGSIAEAVLERLNEKKAFGVVTTHYSNLKLMAEDGNGIINGAMLFDTREMQPLFKLKIGRPGSSFAFEIARKIGFPKLVLKNAEKKTGKTQLDFDQQLQQLEIEKKELNQKQKEIRVADDFLNELVEKYEKLNKDLQQRKSDILEKAKNEAKTLFQASNKLIENTIKEIKESQAQKEKTKKIREELKEKSALLLKEKEEKKTAKPIIKQKTIKEKADAAIDSKISVGDFVNIKDQGVFGEVISMKGEDVVIDFNSVRLRTTTSRLEKANDQKGKLKNKNRKTSYSGIINELNDKMANFKLQIDVRGKRSEEAIAMIKQYIDDAALLSVSEVSILHGKGHGILRSLIHEYLRSIPEIKSFKDEHIERGGHGITLVILK